MFEQTLSCIWCTNLFNLVSTASLSCLKWPLNVKSWWPVGIESWWPLNVKSWWPVRVESRWPVVVESRWPISVESCWPINIDIPLFNETLTLSLTDLFYWIKTIFNQILPNKLFFFLYNVKLSWFTRNPKITLTEKWKLKISNLEKFSF